MLSKLERQFTLSAWLLTCLVVAVMMVIICILSISQAENAYVKSLSNYTDAISSKISVDNSVSDYWLGELERSGGLIIDISMASGELLFEGNGSADSDRGLLLEAAKSKARKAGVTISNQFFDTDTRIAEYRIDDVSSESYVGRSEVIVLGSEKVMLTVLMKMSGFEKQRANIIFTYLAIALVATGALFLVSSFLACKAVRPVENSIKSQKEFVAAASHELRSPLAVIKAGASAASMSGNNTEFFPVLDSEIDRMARLVDNLLALTRADAGTWDVVKAEIDTETLLLEIYERNVPVAASFGRQLELNVPGEILPAVTGDSMRIRQVVEILLNNAFEYATPRTDIILGAALHRNKLEIYVEDQGPGIPDQEKSKIFGRFYRGDTSRTRKEHFGLGLSIAEEYARLMGGSLTLRDSTSGGSVFILSLTGKTK